MKFLRKILRHLFDFRKQSKGERISRWADIAAKLERETLLFLEENPKFRSLHVSLARINDEQKQNWPSMVYCDGLFYQGYERIGAFGVKPSETRLENYQIRDYLATDKTVLDIGGNAGFWACVISENALTVDAVEVNPYLIRMGAEVVDFLGIKNVNLIQESFENFSADKRYDVVFSLSNHHTIDGQLNIPFHQYIEKIYDLTEPNGVLFFESHNIFSDDSDLEEKFLIASKFFTLEKHKMVNAFYDQDIDKLFAIFRRNSKIIDSPSLNFKLGEAYEKYVY